MTDETDRRLADIEKRLARLERMQDKPAWVPTEEWAASKLKGQFCHCGRDVCRAPNCFSHKKGGA